MFVGSRSGSRHWYLSPWCGHTEWKTVLRQHLLLLHMYVPDTIHRLFIAYIPQGRLSGRKQASLSCSVVKNTILPTSGR